MSDDDLIKFRLQGLGHINIARITGANPNWVKRRLRALVASGRLPVRDPKACRLYVAGMAVEKRHPFFSKAGLQLATTVSTMPAPARRKSGYSYYSSNYSGVY